jgi:Flp pilus assembly protein TadG
MPRVCASKHASKQANDRHVVDASRDRGAMLVFTALVGIAMAAAVTLALVPVLAGLMERQQAQSAADAAALAGVTGGRGASADLAAANGGVLTLWSRTGYQVTVTVRFGDHDATARATDEP